MYEALSLIADHDAVFDGEARAAVAGRVVVEVEVAVLGGGEAERAGGVDDGGVVDGGGGGVCAGGGGRAGGGVGGVHDGIACGGGEGGEFRRVGGGVVCSEGVGGDILGFGAGAAWEDDGVRGGVGGSEHCFAREEGRVGAGEEVSAAFHTYRGAVTREVKAGAGCGGGEAA